MSHAPDAIRHVGHLFRRSPALGSIVYLSSMAGVLEAAYRLVYDQNDPYSDTHLPAMPFVAAISYAFARIHPEAAAAWHRPPTRCEVRALCQGLALGSGAILSVFGIAAAKGWVSAPAWGWTQAPAAQVARSVAILSTQQLALVFNEELVFRGYGLDSLTESFGTPTAICVSLALFVVYHGLGYRQMVGMLLGGMVLTLLRLRSGGLWLPFGFHWAWNIFQVAIFGPANGPHSLRPLHLHGPQAWIGTPGEPEPGLLSICILAALALLLGLRMRRHPTTPGVS